MQSGSYSALRSLVHPSTIRLLAVLLFSSVIATAQTASGPGRISGTVKDPDSSVVAGAQVVLTNRQTNARTTTATDGQGGYLFPVVQSGAWAVEVDATGFQASVSPDLKVDPGQTVNYDFTMTLAGVANSVTVSAGTAETGYRVDNVATGGPLGNLPILDLPYSVNVISRQLIDDTQSRNFKEAARYLPLVSFQEMQGPEVLRPESRGMQGSNMQNDRKDGMGIAVTTPSAMEEYEQIEAVTGLGGPLFGPANPSGMFNFVTKRPTDQRMGEVDLDYEGKSVGTVHTDLGGRVGKNKMFGYRANLLLGDGGGYVEDSQLRRQLAAVAGDVRITNNTVIEGNYSYYNLFQWGYPGWFSYTPSTNILLPPQAPDPTIRGYGQSFAGVDLTSQIGELRLKHGFGPNWQLTVGGLNQLSNRNITTPVNSLINNNGGYQSYLANTFSSLAPRFHVDSDLLYLTGRFNTGKIRHDVVIGSTGYRFASYTPVSSPVKTPLCTADGICQASIANPLIFLGPAGGPPSYDKTSPSTGIYVSSIIRQQGFSFSDTVTLTPRWLFRVSASQDWTWTDSYSINSKANYAKVWSGGYVSQGVSPSASLMFKPRADMTIYATFADSIQAPDVAGASTSTTIIVNANQALPPYRSKEGEVGYKWRVRRLNFSTAIFRIDRPFANYATGVIDPACGTQSGTINCQAFRITGTQVNYGAEAMLSGRLFDRLIVTGGLTVLNPKLTDTGIAATNNRNFVGIPDYKSNILAEYHVPVLVGLFVNMDWQHVGRRPIDDINSLYTPQFNTFDFGARYTTRFFEKITTFRVTVSNVTNVAYWSTLGPGSITGQSTNSYLGHLGEPRLVTASMRFEF